MVLEVYPCLFQGVRRGYELHVLKVPEAEQTRVPPIGSGEEYVGIEERPIQLLGHGRLVVWDFIRVQPQSADRFNRAGVILCIHGVGKEQRRPTFRCVNFEG